MWEPLLSVLYRIEKGYKESENKKEARARASFLFCILFPKVTVLDGERGKKEKKCPICET